MLLHIRRAGAEHGGNKLLVENCGVASVRSYEDEAFWNPLVKGLRNAQKKERPEEELGKEPLQWRWKPDGEVRDNSKKNGSG